MTSIRGLAMRFFRKNKFVAATSMISVAISVTLILSMMLFVYNAKQSLHNEVIKTYGNMDLSVGYNSNQHKTIDTSMLDYISSNKQIEKSSNVLITRIKVNELNSSDIYTVGVENDYLAKSRYHFQTDLSNSKLIVNERLARSLNIKEGSNLNIEDNVFTVAEIITNYDAAGVALDIMILSREDVKKIIAKYNRKDTEATYILMKIKKGSDVFSVANQFRKSFPELRVDIANEDEFTKSQLHSLDSFLTVLSVLLLIITSLLIIANFDIYLYKYKNQFAIMRTLGATSKQLFKLALFQSSIINIIGSTCGLGIAYLSNEIMQRWMNTLFSDHNYEGTFHFSYTIPLTVICMIFIEIFMLIPSIKITRMLPISIFKSNEKLNFSSLKTRKKWGNYFFISSMVFILIALIATLLHEDVGVLFIVCSSLLLLSSMTLLLPVYVSQIFQFLLPLIRFIFGKTSFVAVKNVIPQARKNTFVMMSIAIMIVISIFGAATLKTVSNNEERYLKKQYATDILAVNRLGYDSEVDKEEFNKAVKSIGTVESVFETSTAFEATMLNGHSKGAFDYILGDLKEMTRIKLLPSFIEEPQNSIVLTKDFARSRNIKIGDKMELGLFSIEVGDSEIIDEVVVATIVDEIPGTELPVLLDWSNKNFNNKYTRFSRAFITTKNPEETLQELDEVRLQFPEIQFNSLDQSIVQSKEIYTQRWTIFKVFLFVILACVSMGVFETLISNIYAKRKELAVLRMMNIGKNGVRKVILTQVILFLLFGILFGGIAGILLTLIINLIDVNAGIASFDFSNFIEIVALIVSMGMLIFIPFGNRLAKTNLSSELHQDNK
ncbi:FtsX-like permease family protein [Cohnella endophytica]|uniref:FtsX-like permease family protein n=1 Tax=Cohnella endophytica TaxID=2419778 RepID=A0A494XGX0_9BACL|nr:ABC transporter permease [Cohnella endophytica]RKP48961.1 FtsX-like permease family protein [Cohnella endophytica]